MYWITLYDLDGLPKAVTRTSSWSVTIMRAFRYLITGGMISISSVPDMQKRITWRKSELARGGCGLTKYMRRGE